MKIIKLDDKMKQDNKEYRSPEISDAMVSVDAGFCTSLNSATAIDNYKYETDKDW